MNANVMDKCIYTLMPTISLTIYFTCDSQGCHQGNSGGTGGWNTRTSTWQPFGGNGGSGGVWVGGNGGSSWNGGNGGSGGVWNGGNGGNGGGSCGVWKGGIWGNGGDGGSDGFWNGRNLENCGTNTNQRHFRAVSWRLVFIGRGSRSAQRNPPSFYRKTDNQKQLRLESSAPARA
ncbi:hypothetical protein AM593_03058, partial [Mytilus galloprovincialis]